jgi:hypothetical protein
VTRSARGQAIQRSFGGRRHEGRDPHDWWPTPQDCTVALMRFLREHEPVALDLARRDGILEPACGDGAIARELEAMGFRVRGCDLIDRGYGTGGVDFLTAPPPSERVMITNLPFGLAAQFIARAAQLRRVTLTAFLMPGDYWQAGTRVDLFEAWRPSWILPLAWRPDFTGGGSGTMQLAWNVWSRDSESAWQGRTRPLRRPTYTPGGGLWR